jgi:hypothetical protein
VRVYELWAFLQHQLGFRHEDIPPSDAALGASATLRAAWSRVIPEQPPNPSRTDGRNWGVASPTGGPGGVLKPRYRIKKGRLVGRQKLPGIFCRPGMSSSQRPRRTPEKRIYFGLFTEETPSPGPLQSPPGTWRA